MFEIKSVVQVVSFLWMSSPFPPPGPSLPNFRSIAFEGHFHSSAPFHLCITHLNNSEDSHARALFITPNRDVLKTALKGFNDDWLASNEGKGQLISVIMRIDILYAPTPAHLSFLLSTLRVASTLEVPLVSEKKLVLERVPSLIVLNQPSAYFTPSSEHPTATVSSYLNLVANLFSTADFLSGGNETTTPSIAVFDTQFGSLKLPVLKPTDSQISGRVESIKALASGLFDWTCTFHESAFIPASAESGDGFTQGSLTLYRVLGPHNVANTEGVQRSIHWKWKELECSVPGWLGETRKFVWEEGKLDST